MDATRVITWLRPVRESRSNVFWKKFSFPLNVRVSFPFSTPHYVDCTNEDGGGMTISWRFIFVRD